MRSRLLEVRLAAYDGVDQKEEVQVAQPAEEELPFYDSYDALLGELDMW